MLRTLPDSVPLPPDERVGRDRRALRRVVEEHVEAVRDQIEQIAALIRCGELDSIGPGVSASGSERFERLRRTLEGCLPALERFLDDDA